MAKTNAEKIQFALNTISSARKQLIDKNNLDNTIGRLKDAKIELFGCSNSEKENNIIDSLLCHATYLQARKVDVTQLICKLNTFQLNMQATHTLTQLQTIVTDNNKILIPTDIYMTVLQHYTTTKLEAMQAQIESSLVDKSADEISQLINDILLEPRLPANVDWPWSTRLKEKILHRITMKIVEYYNDALAPIEKKVGIFDAADSLCKMSNSYELTSSILKNALATSIINFFSNALSNHPNKESLVNYINLLKQSVKYFNNENISKLIDLQISASTALTTLLENEVQERLTWQSGHQDGGCGVLLDQLKSEYQFQLECLAHPSKATPATHLIEKRITSHRKLSELTIQLINKAILPESSMDTLRSSRDNSLKMISTKLNNQDISAVENIDTIKEILPHIFLIIKQYYDEATISKSIIDNESYIKSVLYYIDIYILLSKRLPLISPHIQNHENELVELKENINSTMPVSLKVQLLTEHFYHAVAKSNHEKVIFFGQELISLSHAVNPQTTKTHTLPVPSIPSIYTTMTTSYLQLDLPKETKLIKAIDYCKCAINAGASTKDQLAQLIDLLNQMLELHPLDHNTIHLKTEIQLYQLQLGRLNKASEPPSQTTERDMIIQALSVNANVELTAFQPQALFDLATDLLDRRITIPSEINRFQVCERILNHLHSITKYTITAANMLGHLYMQFYRHEEAVTHFAKAANLGHARSHHYLGEYFLQSKNQAKAFQHFTAASPMDVTPRQELLNKISTIQNSLPKSTPHTKIQRPTIYFDIDNTIFQSSGNHNSFYLDPYNQRIKPVNVDIASYYIGGPEFWRDIFNSIKLLNVDIAINTAKPLSAKENCPLYRDLVTRFSDIFGNNPRQIFTNGGNKYIPMATQCYEYGYDQSQLGNVILVDDHPEHLKEAAIAGFTVVSSAKITTHADTLDAFKRHLLHQVELAIKRVKLAEASAQNTQRLFTHPTGRFHPYQSSGPTPGLHYQHSAPRHSSFARGRSR